MSTITQIELSKQPEIEILNRFKNPKTCNTVVAFDVFSKEREV